MPEARDSRHSFDDILAVVKRYWGFDSLRPIQSEAIRAGIDSRDSLVVMPTGGGKSLCYQVPPLVTGKVSVVVSPLIALMKDQVDGLKLVGYPAAALHSGLEPDEAREIERRVAMGEIKLLLMSPERLLTEWTGGILRRAGVESFAIDEAHCISQWGHDFRPEYRRLAELRERFPGVSLHAYTATATPTVRADIVEQLQLRSPTVLVGTFDRPNLTYRILPRVSLSEQVLEALERHKERAAIVYTISRKDTETLAGTLSARGVNAKAYHAGLDAGTRSRIQDEFQNEKLHVVVATVAFGMGIDRSDVRCVVHAAMPKTIEAYQQETGRAGRDGLPSECVLLYSAADIMRWKQVMTRSADEQGTPAEVVEAQLTLLAQMQRFSTSARCRHRALSEYFGQEYQAPVRDDSVKGCGACDYCLDELEAVADSVTIARKILSCVARVNQSFGAKHVTDVLIGKKSARIMEKGHDQLSTFGLLKDLPPDAIGSYINQLIDQGVLDRSGTEYPVLTLTKASAPVLRNERVVTLHEAKRVARAKVAKSVGGSLDESSLTPVEKELFEELRNTRREIAQGLGVPPFVVFSDVTLTELARVRPGSIGTMANIKGIGRSKLEQFGEPFLRVILEKSHGLRLPLDAAPGSRGKPAPPPKRSSSSIAAAERFAKGATVEEVATAMSRAVSTVQDYLCEHVLYDKPVSVDPWVDHATYGKVSAALEGAGNVPLKVVFDSLGGTVPYDTIRIVRDHLKGRTEMGAKGR